MLLGTGKKIIQTANNTTFCSFPHKNVQFTPMRMSSATAQLRASKLRTLIKTPQDPYGDYMILEERIGDDFKVNWQLGVHDVTPTKDAFRNLHLRGLISQATGKLDTTKALHVKSNDTTIPSKEVDEQTFKNVKRNITKNNIFMCDGAIGASRFFETRVRVLTDDATIALSLQHTLPKVPLTVPEAFDASVVAYVSSTYPSPVNGIHAATGSIVIAGTSSSAVVKNALFAAAVKQLLAQPEKNVVPLVGDVIEINGKSVLVVNTNNLLLKQKLNQKVLAAQNVFWTPSGVVRAWTGVTYPYKDGVKLQKGDLVESLNDNTSSVTTSLPAANVLNHPTSIVFLVSDSQGFLPTLSKLNPTQAAQFLASGYSGSETFFTSAVGASGADANQVVKAFKQLLQDSKANVFVVNSAAKGVELGKILNATADGSAAGAKVGSGFTTLSPVSELAGVKLEKGDASKEQAYVNQVKNNFANVTF